MKYQIIANILFVDKAEADKLFERLKKLQGKTHKPQKPKKEVDDESYVKYFECRHDEDPQLPCTEVDAIVFEVI